jgi:hypothetical protein
MTANECTAWEPGALRVAEPVWDRGSSGAIRIVRVTVRDSEAETRPLFKPIEWRPLQ